MMDMKEMIVQKNQSADVFMDIVPGIVLVTLGANVYLAGVENSAMNLFLIFLQKQIQFLVDFQSKLVFLLEFYFLKKI